MLLTNLINYAILFVLIIVFACILVWVGRKCTVITTLSLYCLLSSALIVVHNNNLFEYLNFYENVSATFDNFALLFSSLFSLLYSSFISLIVSLLSSVINEGDLISFFDSSNIIFFIAFHFVLFVICLVLFRRKNKSKIERSRYCD